MIGSGGSCEQEGRHARDRQDRSGPNEQLDDARHVRSPARARRRLSQPPRFARRARPMNPACSISQTLDHGRSGRTLSAWKPRTGPLRQRRRKSHHGPTPATRQRSARSHESASSVSTTCPEIAPARRPAASAGLRTPHRGGGGMWRERRCSPCSRPCRWREARSPAPCSEL
jgi:hypothetical protein